MKNALLLSRDGLNFCIMSALQVDQFDWRAVKTVIPSVPVAATVVLAAVPLVFAAKWLLTAAYFYFY